MKKILIIIAMALAFATVPACAETYADKVERMAAIGDIAGLRAEVAEVTATADESARTLYERAKAVSCLRKTIEASEGEKKEREGMALESIALAERSLAAAGLDSDERAEAYFVVATENDRLIRDAPSWMARHAAKENALAQCLAIDPGHRGGRLLRALSLIHGPMSADGDRAKGKEEIDELYGRNPEWLPVLLARANEARDKKEYDDAERITRDAAALYPENAQLRANLAEYSIMRREPTVRRVTVTGKTKLPKKRIERKARAFIGEKYTFDTKDRLLAKVSEIEAVWSCEATAHLVGSNEVDVEIAVGENNLIVLGAIGYAAASLDYDKDPQFTGFPALLYNDANFFGSGNSMSVIFAGPYFKINYAIPGLIGDRFPDVDLGWSSNFLGSDSTKYSEGIPEKNQELHSAEHIATLKVGKKSDIGLYGYLEGTATYHDWEASDRNDAENFAEPGETLAYEGVADIGIDTIGGGMGSKLDRPDGFSVSIKPGIIWQPDYDAWGDRDDRVFAHDDKPGFKFSSTARYCKKIGARHGFEANVGFQTGWNVYETEKWAMGEGNPMSSGPSLDGFYAGEFRYTTGVVADFGYQIQPIPDRFSLFAKYDVFLDADSVRVYHGTAIGSAVKLPKGFELSAQAGIGVNAERENGPGVEISMLLTRIWLF